MPKKISIKTVDGNRYEQIVETGAIDFQNTPLWVCLKLDSTRRYFYVPNIVSIKESEVEDG